LYFLFEEHIWEFIFKTLGVFIIPFIMILIGKYTVPINITIFILCFVRFFHVILFWSIELIKLIIKLIKKIFS
jgi:hypothetical protein